MDTLQPGLFDAELAMAGPNEAGCAGMTAEDKRRQGITLTPEWLVDLMLRQVAMAGPFDTLVDPGAGTGRFCIAAARYFPAARIVAVESSPAMAAALHRRLAAEGLAHRVQVVEQDFREAALGLTGRTAFVGNPPYVRHHDLGAHWKQWYAQTMARLGQPASQLAGLHLHFLARVAELARPGDHLCFVTSAEWLDNGYGSAWRRLLGAAGAQLQLRGLWVADPQTAVFPDALVSAVVMEAACAPKAEGVRLGVLEIGALQSVRSLPLAALSQATRWTPLCQPALSLPSTGIELGELFRITRGQVTGLNSAWVLPLGSDALPAALTLPVVTRAREIIDGTIEADDALLRLRRVPNLPGDLSLLSASVRARLDAFLAVARAKGAADAYVARQRRAWYALDLRAPPVAMVSYMGRRPPVFRANPHSVSFLNIAHGLYARQPLAPQSLRALLDFLNSNTEMRAGRLYGGGMAKFEPSDIARLRVPPAALAPKA